ncbi:hypothetical protein FB005_15314 [Sinorhizobium medicae]|nr:hypothetical protein [Sinorhizobium medicae]TWA12164.1 hypothetical protein FB006_15515 [Sinorhizobium medicae]TWA33172.1 hypothetical protein FB005_15314 [Sinorhizobium medicae]
MSQKTLTMLSGFVQRRIRSEVGGRPRTITVDVMRGGMSTMTRSW